MTPLMIVNEHTEIKETNYWDLEHAERGFCYLSGNAGIWRLLVPPATEFALEEMKTGKRVIIETSEQPGCVDLVFDDGTPSPFTLTISREQMDRAIKPPGRTTLAVWTKAGKQMVVECEVRG